MQVLKNGKWAAVEPISNAFVVNLGDQLQVEKKSRSIYFSSFQSVQEFDNCIDSICFVCDLNNRL